MSHSKNRHGHKEGKKQHKGAVPVSQPEHDESHNPQQTDSSKTKPFDDIIKGFKEIEKIEHTESSPVSQSENDESGKTNKNGSSKSKSYAEIIKGFQEIEKIISNSQIPE
jgi:negative regulator of genetic competence, sporulation and motility